MAYKRVLTSLIRHRSSSIFNLSNPQSLHSLKTLASSHLPSLQLIPHILNLPDFNPQFLPNRSFSSSPTKNPKTPKVIEDEDDESDEEWDEDDDDDDDDDEDEYEDEESDGNEAIGSGNARRVYSAERKIAEAEDIGYKVIGPLQPSDRVFKPYVPVFAVVQIGSHQFKVSNGDSIYVEKLKFCDVNDKLVLNKVLMLGSPTQTIIGRPIVPDSAVHAVVEEHALDAKVIIFKKKRRKNYRRTKGHRQELTRLRITDIQGIEKPKTISRKVSETSTSKKVEEVAVPA